MRYRVGGDYNPTTGCYQTDWRHFAFKCINNAIIQEVSCFVIGNAVHHWTASGGECTITNSNSNFGATSLLSSGFKGIGGPRGAFSQDQDFLVCFVQASACSTAGWRQHPSDQPWPGAGLRRCYGRSDPGPWP